MTETKLTVFLLTTSVFAFLSPGFYGILGSVGFFAHEILQGSDEFKYRTMFIYAFLGFLVAFMVHDLSIFLLGKSWSGLLIASGFSVRKITEVANKWLAIVKV